MTDPIPAPLDIALDRLIDHAETGVDPMEHSPSPFLPRGRLSACNASGEHIALFQSKHDRDLFLAAPDLLAFARDYVKYVEDIVEALGLTDQVSVAILSVHGFRLAAARAAIAKAEGR